MKTRTKRRGILAATGALLTAAALALGGAVAAQAAPVINPATPGSINITKLSQPTAHGAGNGLQEANPAGSSGLQGATFTLQKVNVDLTTNAGWEAAQALTPDAVAGNLVPAATFPTRTVTTNTDGRARFGTTTLASPWDTVTGAAADTAQLPVGLYLVTETVTPSGYTGSAPFLVSVPLTHPTQLDTWLYDVFVYPKNTAKPTKTVADAAAIDLTDNVVWTIGSGLSLDPATGNTVSGYLIADKLDGRLTYESATVKIDGVLATPVTDYTLTVTPATWVAGSEQVVTVEFTTTGLGKLTTAANTNPQARVEVELTTSVNLLNAAGNAPAPGEISNQAFVFGNADDVIWAKTPGNDPTDPLNNPGEPSNSPVTKWGSINFTKQTPGSAPLQDAEFQVFASEADAATKTNPLTALNAAGAEVTTFTSAANGTVVISGLRYSNWVNGALIGNVVLDGFQEYWLVETQAPTGYELLATPIKVTVNDPVTAVAVTGATAGALNTVVNVEANAGFALPLTGGTGTLLLTIGGIAILAIVALVIVRRRHGAETSAE